MIMDQPNIVWYVTYEDALNNNNPLENNRPLENDHVYYAAIIDHNGCSSLPTPITVTITLGIKDLDLAALKYYPNPTDSEINISYKEAIRTIEVYDLLGKLIKVEKFNSNDIKMNVSNLSAGTYIFRIKTESGSQFVKIIKE